MEKIKNINLQRVKNPLVVERDEVMLIEIGANDTLLDIRNKFYPQDVPCVVVRNGEIIQSEKLGLYFPVPDDRIIITPDIFGGGHGGDNEGKQILGAVLMIAVAIAAPYALAAIGIGGFTTAGAFAIGGSILLGSLAIAGVVVAGGLLVNALLPPPKPKMPSVDGGDFDVSRAYSWNPQPTQQAGIPIQRVYGTHKIETPNIISSYIENVNDKQYVNILMGLGMGPYKSLSDFKINDQPVTYYQGVELYTRLGNLNQEIIPTFNNTKSEYPLSIKITQSTPYTYLTINNSFDEAEIDVTFPQGLFYSNDSGGLDAHSVSIKIERKKIGDALWTTIVEEAVTGAQTASIRRTYKTGTLVYGQYEFKITKVSIDQTSYRYGDDMYLTAVREVYYDDFEYPNQVLVAVKALATDQLSGSIKLSCMAEGSMVRIYNSGTQTWSVDMTDNPAWIVYDILTKPIFDNNLNVLEYEGFNPSRLILQDFVDLATYCNELVPNGRGGTEKRCTFNGIFDCSQSTWSAVLSVLQLARAIPTWNGINIGIVIDKKVGSSELDGISQVFGMGNIAKDSFKESWSSGAQRAATLQTDYINAELGYKRETCTRVNRNINSNNSLRLPLFGATKASQVWRELDFRLEKNEKLCNTVKIDAGIEAIRCTLGDKVGIAHDVPQWGYSGRILDATINTATLDREITIEAGKSYTLLVQFQNDTIEIKTVANAPGTYSVIQVSTPFSAIPEKYCNYSFGENLKYIKPFKVIGISPHEDYKRRTLAMIEYNGTIYDKDYNLPTVPTFNYTSIDPLPSVSGLKIEERLIKALDGTLRSTIDVYFNPPSSSTWRHAEIWYQKNSIWAYSGISLTGKYTIENVEEGKTYTVVAVSVNAAGKKQDKQNAAQDSIYVFGKTLNPADIAELWGQASIGGLRLDWFPVSDVDLDCYKIRYTPDTASGTWDNAIDVAIAYSTSITLPAALSGMYLIKAVDTTGNESENAKELITNIPTILNWNVQEELIEDPAFTGTKTGMYVDGGELYLDATGLFDDIPDFDAVTNLDRYAGGTEQVGYYETAVVNLGSVQTARCSANVKFQGMNAETIIDDITEFDAIPSLDGDITEIGIILQIALSQDGSSWGEWQNFFAGDYTAKAFKFRVKAYSNHQAQYLKIMDLEFYVDMPDRIESGQDVVIPAGGQTIPFTKSFMVKPKIGLTIQSANAGDYYDLQAVDTNGFTVQIKNSGGTGISKIIDWESKGY